MTEGTVAALYIDARGPYVGLLGADACYDEERDARTFKGSCPVVVHPPCGPWGRLKHLNRFQDPAHAVHALAVVRANGGVLEHPKDSGLWADRGMPKPGCLPDAWGGWTLEVDQVRWGHVARKRTWLYVVGCSREALPELPPDDKQPTHWISGARKRKIRSGGVVPEGIKVCSAEQRRRTPPAFAEWLIAVARRCARG